MEYTTLGRTGLKVSVAGLGCGGNSRIGLSAGRSMEEAASVVRTAIGQGVTLASVDLDEEIWATPAIADGNLYVRTRGKLYAFGTAAK